MTTAIFLPSSMAAHTRMLRGRAEVRLLVTSSLAPVLVVAFLLLGGAVYVASGTLPGLPLAVASAAVLAAALFRDDRLSARTLGCVLVVAGVLEAIDPLPPFTAPLLVGLIVAQIVVALAVLARPALAGRRALGVVLAIYAMSGAYVLRVHPAPAIDVFWLQQAGSAALERGDDPYGGKYPNQYTPEQTRVFFGDDRKELHGYLYPPLTLVATTAAHRLTGDVRWAQLAIQLAIGWLLFELASGAGHGPEVAIGLASLHFLHPRGLFVLDQSWTDPALGAAFLGVLALLQRSRRGALGPALGLFAVSKQYSVLVLPLLWKDGRVPARAWLVGLATALAIVVPFFLWGPHDFFEDLIVFQAKQPFRPDAMSIPAFVAKVSGWRAPGALALAGALGAGALSWRRLGEDAPASRLPLATALVYMAFFLCAKQAFCNYYYAVGVLVLGAAALLEPASTQRTQPRSRTKIV
jgi:hypothetical protein